MIHLSGVDASFLHLETPEMPMHVGSLHLLDLPADYKGDFYEDVVKHISERIHLASVFERKLAAMPFEMSNPVWVDDDDIDIEYHIRRIVLSKPGSMEQLQAYVGRLHSTLLDRSRPLWEMYVIEGLKSGQMAFYAKVHHAAIDGQAGVALGKALYSLTPDPGPVRKARVRARSNQYQLGVAELATAALQNTVQQYVKLVTTMPGAMRAMASVTIPAFTQLAQGLTQGMAKLNPLTGGMANLALPDLTKPNMGLGSLGLGPRTPLNVSITNQRAFAGRSVSLAETKGLAKRVGVSLNDMVMAACSGALRKYMRELDVKLDSSMTAAIPVSLREAGNEDPNNQVTMMLASLATDLKDPLERLKAIHASTASSKELTGAFKAAIPTDFPSFGAPWIMTGLATLFGRSKIADNLPPIANVAISNVPGVPVPLYLAGAKMVSYFPVSIPAHGCALNITVQSYNGSLDYGLTACRRAVPDVADIADYIVEAHAELAKLIMALPAPAAAAKPVEAKAGMVMPTMQTPPPVAPPKVPAAMPVQMPAVMLSGGNGQHVPAQTMAAPVVTAVVKSKSPAAVKAAKPRKKAVVAAVEPAAAPAVAKKARQKRNGSASKGEMN
jgi:diacylglycerol O-acyltransferase / wax synthase